MNVVLLAAGLGTRLSPITNSIPKCLVPINEIPLLDYWLTMLTKSKEITNIYINLHYLHDEVIRHLNGRWGDTPNLFTWHESELLGTAGTLHANYDVLKNERCLVVHADNFSIFDMSEFIKQHLNSTEKTKISMMLFETDAPQQCGIVELDSENYVMQMHEKVQNPPGNWANGAVYIFESDVLDYIKEHNIKDISLELIPHYFGKIKGWINDIYHRDIGTPESYAQANIDAPTFNIRI